VVQVNGKLRARLMISSGASKHEIEASALANEHVYKSIEGKNVVKTVLIPNKLVNFVVK
jgi:leucyl-tRNA synthetase